MRDRILVLVGVAQVCGACGLVGSTDPGVEVARSAVVSDVHDVLTQHNDNARTGAMLNETVLTVDNIRAGLGQTCTLPVDGQVYAQVLYKHQIPTKDTATGITANHNVAYVATLNNTVFAFDADTCAQLWARNLGATFDHTQIPPASGGSVIKAPFGILSTPVIDLATGAMFVVGRLGPGGPTYKIFKLSLTDGSVSQSSAISGSYNAGTTITFNAAMQWNRPALTLAIGTVVVAFGGIDNDAPPFSGWVFGYATSDLSSRGVYATTAVSSTVNGGGIWMSGNGLAADASNALYFTTGNAMAGTSVANVSPTSLLGQADTFVKLQLNASAPFLTLAAWARPGDYVPRNDNDVDLGSGGVMLIPGTSKLIGGGKSGIFYVLNSSLAFTLPARTLDSNVVGSAYSAAAPNGATRNSFVAGINSYHVPAPGWTTSAGNTCTVDTSCGVIQGTTINWGDYCNATEAQYDSCMWYGPNIHGSPATWTGPDGKKNIYLWTEKDYLRRFQYSDAGSTSLTFAEHSPIRQTKDLMPSGVVSISANGSTSGTGVVWATTTELSPYICNNDITLCFASHYTVKGHLWAFDAENVGHILFHAPIDTHAKFNPPTIANGHVFVPTFSNKVLVFGLNGSQIRPDPRVAVYRWRDTHTNEWTSFAADEALDPTQTTDAVLTAFGYTDQTFQFYGRRTGDGPTVPISRWKLNKTGFGATNDWISIGDTEISDPTMQSFGYTDKFFQFYGRTTADPSTVPVYRWADAFGGWITIRDGEISDSQMISFGYTSKTFQFYAPNSHPSVVAVYRWHRASNGEWTSRTATETTDAQMTAAGFDSKTFQFFAKNAGETGTVAVNRWLYPPTGDWITIAQNEVTDAQMMAWGYTSKTLQFYGFTSAFPTSVAVNRWVDHAGGWISLADGEISDAQMQSWGYSSKTFEFYGMK